MNNTDHKMCCISFVYLHTEAWCTVHTTLNKLTQCCCLQVNTSEVVSHYSFPSANTTALLQFHTSKKYTFPNSISLYFPDSPLKYFCTHLSTTEFNVNLSVTGIFFFSDKSIHFSRQVSKKITRGESKKYAGRYPQFLRHFLACW